MKLSDFNYSFPKRLIAYRPLKRRDESRLLVLNRKAGAIEHRKFCDLPDYLRENDCLVLNDTRVIPVFLTASLASGAKVEPRTVPPFGGTGARATMLVLEKIDEYAAKCLVKPAKKFKKGTNIFFANGATAAVTEERPFKVLRFNCPIDKLLKQQGLMPLPPYIKRQPDENDFQAYQTIYAKNIGAVAAPTAGLHFTDGLLKRVLSKGVRAAFLTLHVGYGTFKPVRCENIAEHKMHSERFCFPQETADAVTKARCSGGRIVAVGTTSCRVLETLAKDASGGADSFAISPCLPLGAKNGSTDLFIYPPYQFKLTDILLTNFHLPQTTLLMLVSAFCGHELMMKAYKSAIENEYRFFSYGDAMLIV